MRCPLCSGPLHDDHDGTFRCDVRHQVTGHELGAAANLELTTALWMAIQALDNEADVLRLLDGAGSAAFADAAERQASQLRSFARDQAQRIAPS